VRARFNPETCGNHEIYVKVVGGPRTSGDTVSQSLDVDMDLRASIDYLTVWAKKLNINFPGNAERRTGTSCSVIWKGPARRSMPVR